MICEGNLEEAINAYQQAYAINPSERLQSRISKVEVGVTLGSL